MRSKSDGQFINVTINEILDESETTERHLHNQEKCLGAAASPSGETHIADKIGPGILPFSLVSGNNNWGNWVQVIGSTDTPIKSGYLYFDAHAVQVTDADDTNPFFIQIVGGESAGIAARITAGNYSTLSFKSSTNQINEGRSPVITSRVPVGTKVWARCICIGSNAKTIKVYPCIHEYES